jgi:hypothetical protein
MSSTAPLSFPTVTTLPPSAPADDVLAVVRHRLDEAVVAWRSASPGDDLSAQWEMEAAIQNVGDLGHPDGSADLLRLLDPDESMWAGAPQRPLASSTRAVALSALAVTADVRTAGTAVVAALLDRSFPTTDFRKLCHSLANRAPAHFQVPLAAALPHLTNRDRSERVLNVLRHYAGTDEATRAARHVLARSSRSSRDEKVLAVALLAGEPGLATLVDLLRSGRDRLGVTIATALLAPSAHGRALDAIALPQRAEIVDLLLAQFDRVPKDISRRPLLRAATQLDDGRRAPDILDLITTRGIDDVDTVAAWALATLGPAADWDSATAHALASAATTDREQIRDAISNLPMHLREELAAAATAELSRCAQQIGDHPPVEHTDGAEPSTDRLWEKRHAVLAPGRAATIALAATNLPSGWATLRAVARSGTDDEIVATAVGEFDRSPGSQEDLELIRDILETYVPGDDFRSFAVHSAASGVAYAINTERAIGLLSSPSTNDRWLRIAVRTGRVAARFWPDGTMDVGSALHAERARTIALDTLAARGEDVGAILAEAVRPEHFGESKLDRSRCVIDLVRNLGRVQDLERIGADTSLPLTLSIQATSTRTVEACLAAADRRFMTEALHNPDWTPPAPEVPDLDGCTFGLPDDPATSRSMGAVRRVLRRRRRSITNEPSSAQAPSATPPGLGSTDQQPQARRPGPDDPKPPPPALGL